MDESTRTSNATCAISRDASRSITRRRAAEEEIVFTSGATDEINLVSYAWVAPRLKPGDEIVLSSMGHHASNLSWRFLRKRQRAVLK